MLLFPADSSRIVNHEQMRTFSNNYHMRRVYKGSGPDVMPADRPWEEHAEASRVDQLEPAIVAKA